MAPLKLTQPNCCHFCVTSFGHVITKLWSSLKFIIILRLSLEPGLRIRFDIFTSLIYDVKFSQNFIPVHTPVLWKLWSLIKDDE